MKIFVSIAVTLLIVAAAGAGFVYAGGVNFAADEPHSPLVFGAIQTARERFIASRSSGIEVPDLSDKALIAQGAAHYVPMCSGCHLGPGTQDTEIRRGLYPQPPNLAQPEHAGHGHDLDNASAARQFWIIKHGIKATAMPAWGATHDDQSIWALVAFVQQLPEMSPEHYAALSTSPEDHHSHSASSDADGAPGVSKQGHPHEGHSHDH